MAVVNRRTFTAARGKQDEAVELLKGAAKSTGVRFRIYRSYYGRFDEIAVELEFDSVADLEAMWARFLSQSGADDFFARWNALTLGGQNEVWTLEADG
jgi:hypothetical protein